MHEINCNVLDLIFFYGLTQWHQFTKAIRYKAFSFFLKQSFWSELDVIIRNDP